MNFFGFKPAAPTVAATMEALNRAREAQAGAADAVEAAKQARDALLLDGKPAQLDAAEKALATARGDTERADAVVKQLEARLADAERLEVQARVERERAASADANAALQRWYEETFPGLLATLEEGKRLLRDVGGARHQWNMHQKDALDRLGLPEAENAPGGVTAEALDWRERVRVTVVT